MDDFEKLVTEYQDVVCAVAYAVLRDRARSEEVAQEAFLVTWQQLQRGEVRTGLPAWLCGVARNLARNAARRRKEIPMTDEPSEVRADARQELIEREERMLAERALATLSERDREAIVLFYRGERSMRQVAEAAGISEEAARQRVHRGKQRLRDAVAAVELSLRRGAPGPAFTAACVAALATRGAAASASTSAAERIRPARSGGAGLPLAGVAAVGVGLLAVGAIVVGPWRAGPSRSDAAHGPPPDRARAEHVASTSPSERPLGRIPPRAVSPTGHALPEAALAAEPALSPVDRTVDLDFAAAPAADLITLLAGMMDAPVTLEGDLSLSVNLRVHGMRAIDALDEVLAQAGATRRDTPAVLVVAGGSLDAAALGGAPVSLHVERAPLRDVLAMIAPALGRPLGVASDVAEDITVTLALDHVPAGAALAHVLRSTGLGHRPTTGFVVSGVPR